MEEGTQTLLKDPFGQACSNQSVLVRQIANVIYSESEINNCKAKKK